MIDKPCRLSSLTITSLKSNRTDRIPCHHPPPLHSLPSWQEQPRRLQLLEHHHQLGQLHRHHRRALKISSPCPQLADQRCSYLPAQIQPCPTQQRQHQHQQRSG